MSFLFSLAVRNLGRNLRRTIITSTAVVFGVAIMIIGWGLVDGLDENVLRAARGTTTGDLLLRPADYPTDGLTWPVDESLPPPTLSVEGDVTARALFSGRIVHGADAMRGIVVAYDPATEEAVFPREGFALEGAWPSAEKPGVVLGHRLGELLGVKPGDEVMVEARTRAGAINALSYPVTGLVRVNSGQFDAAGLWMPMPAAEELAVLEGARTHVAVRLRSGSPEAAKAALAAPGWTAVTLREDCADLIALNSVRRKALTVLVGMIMLIAATGIANTVIMAAFERVREIGTLLSLGMRKADVRMLFLMEGAAMGLGAGLVGALLGSVAVRYWEANGIDIGGAVNAIGGFGMSSFLYTRFSLLNTVLSFVLGLGIAVVASIWPARLAANLNPADAVRAD